MRHACGAASYADEDRRRSAYACDGKRAPGASAMPMPRSTQGAAARRASSSAGACGPQAMAARRPPTAMRSPGSNTTTSRIYGGAVGADYRLLAEHARGLCARRRRHQFQRRQRFGTGRSDLFQAGAFVRHNVGAAYLTGALAYGWQDITTDRTVTVAGVDQLRAQFNANALSGRARRRLSLRRRHGWRSASRPTPPASSRPSICRPMPSRSSSGTNTFALAYGAKNVTASRSELGLRADKSFAMPNGDPDAARPRRLGARFQPRPQHRRDVPDAARRASFVVNGAAQARDAALVTGLGRNEMAERLVGRRHLRRRVLRRHRQLRRQGRRALRVVSA